MEWIKAILDTHRKEDGTLEIDAAMDEIKKEFPKNAVPKDVYNQAADDLKSANKLVDDLKESNKSAEDLQGKIADYEKQVEDLKAERLQTQKTYAVKEALQKEGVSDVDYMMFKLGELETDEEGNVKELDNKVKELKEANPTFFGGQDDKSDKSNPPGYDVVDNKLESGKQTDPAEAVVADFEKALGITQD